MARHDNQHLDGVLHALKPKGWFNVLHLSLMLLGTFPLGLQLLSNVFIGQHVSHRCAKPENVSMALLISPFSNYTNVSVIYSQCKIQVVSNTTVLRTDSCLYGMEYDAPIDSSFRSEFGLVCDKTNLAGLTQSMLIAGQAVGAFLGSTLADKYGRRRLAITGGLIILISGLCIAYSTNFIMFVAFKFLVGAGQQTTTMANIALLSEIMVTKHRRIGFIFTGVSWALATVSLDVFAVTMKEYSWRSLQLAISLVSLSVFLQIAFLKESLRWLMANGKRKEAIEVVKFNAKLNGEKPDHIIQKLETIWLNADERKTSEENEAMVNKRVEPTSNKEKVTFLQVLKIPHLLLQTIIIWFTWFTTAFAYFALYLTSTTLAGDKYLNFFLTALMELPSGISSYFIVNRWGRKIVFLANFLIVGVGLIGSGIFRSLEPSSVNSTFALLFSLISMIGVSGSFTFIYNYTIELYPTNIRSQSVGISSLVGRFGGMLAPFTSLLSDHVKWGPGVVIGCLALVVAVLTRFMPETKGRELPQTIEELQDWFRKKHNNKNDHRNNNAVV